MRCCIDSCDSLLCCYCVKITFADEILSAIRQKRLGKNIPIIFRTANPQNFDSAHINSYCVIWYNKIAIDTFTASKLGIVVYDIFNMFAAIDLGTVLIKCRIQTNSHMQMHTVTGNATCSLKQFFAKSSASSDSNPICVVK